MDQKEFVEKLNLSIKENEVNQELLNNDNRFIRAKFLLNIINSISKFMKYFDFGNDIIFENKIPFIKINKVKLMICNNYYLKGVGKKITSNFAQTENFLSTLNINPINIIDIGACWGECSLHLASIYPNSRIFSIEGSLKNYNIFKINLLHNSTFNSNIIPYHLIISDTDGYEEISNDLSTMNVVKKNGTMQKIKFNEYVKVKSLCLLSFLKLNKIPSIDFIKIDIEGSELNLINDFMKADIKAMQLEIINYNSIEKNLDFLFKLSSKFNFHEPFSWKIISIDQLKDLVTNHLKNYTTIDIFLSKSQCS